MLNYKVTVENCNFMIKSNFGLQKNLMLAENGYTQKHIIVISQHIKIYNEIANL